MFEIKPNVPDVKERYKIRNKAELPQAFQDAVLKYLQSGHAENYNKARDNSISIEVALGEGGMEKLHASYNFLLEEFQKRGIDNPIFTDVFFQNEKALKRGEIALHYPTHFEMMDMNIEDKDLKQLAMLRSVMHEAYHSTFSYSVGVRNNIKADQKVGIDIQIEAGGAGYLNALGKSALEEGAAISVESKMLEKINSLFPVEVGNKYEELINKGATLFLAKGQDVDKQSVYLVQSKKNGTNTYSNSGYAGSRRLVVYLASKIPDFDKKLEKLRIHRQALDLARAIEERFGKEVFRKIVTCKPEDASSLLEELKSK